MCADSNSRTTSCGTQARRGGGDPIRELNLTAEQREQIRLIREQNRAERATINQRVRETNRALEEALESDNPDQSVLEQRIQEVSVAQAVKRCDYELRPR